MLQVMENKRASAALRSGLCGGKTEVACGFGYTFTCTIRKLVGKLNKMEIVFLYLVL